MREKQGKRRKQDESHECARKTVKGGERKTEGER